MIHAAIVDQMHLLGLMWDSKEVLQEDTEEPSLSVGPMTLNQLRMQQRWVDPKMVR